MTEADAKLIEEARTYLRGNSVRSIEYLDGLINRLAEALASRGAPPPSPDESKPI